MSRKRKCCTAVVVTSVCLSLTVWKLWGETKETIPEEVNVDRDPENLVNYQPLIEVEGTLHLSPPEMKDYERCTRAAKRRSLCS